jgi:predicted DNA-binding transcriptional regulator YafY
VEPDAPEIVLEAIFTRDVAQHLYETPLSIDQKLEEADVEHVRVTATVKDSQQLRWWLLGFGGQVKIQAPARLSDEFRAIAASMIRTYQKQ